MSLEVRINTDRLNTALTDLSVKAVNLETAGWWGRRQITNSANSALTIIEELIKAPTTCQVNKDSRQLATNIHKNYSAYTIMVDTNHDELFGKPKVENQFSNISTVLRRLNDLDTLTNPTEPPKRRVALKIDSNA